MSTDRKHLQHVITSTLWADARDCVNVPGKRVFNTCKTVAPIFTVCIVYPAQTLPQDSCTNNPHIHNPYICLPTSQHVYFQFLHTLSLPPFSHPFLSPSFPCSLTSTCAHICTLTCGWHHLVTPGVQVQHQPKPSWKFGYSLRVLWQMPGHIPRVQHWSPQTSSYSTAWHKVRNEVCLPRVSLYINIQVKCYIKSQLYPGYKEAH